MPSATTPHLAPADPADLLDEDALYYRRVLHGLIDQGADLARIVHGQAAAHAETPAGDGDAEDGPAPMTLPEAAAAFDRLSRAVRRTVAMARHVAQPLPARPVAPGPERERAAARRQVIRDVEDVRQWSDSDLDLALEAEAAEALNAELSERLDASELDDEIGNRPVAEVIAAICRDLGLGRLPGTHPWKCCTPVDAAALSAWAAKPAGAAAPDVARPAAPSPPPSTPSGAGAGAGLFISDAARVAQMWRVLDEAGWQSPYRPPIREP